ncbi:Peptidase [Trichuris trichiura]|uniref:Peptidase n=1 Tax=Trichuris trichiura TaxID=36087 RepID=A0A077ZMM7_TRITR|nr:Peptidase [Trichuris trichiura]
MTDGSLVLAPLTTSPVIGIGSPRLKKSTLADCEWVMTSLFTLLASEPLMLKCITESVGFAYPQ